MLSIVGILKYFRKILLGQRLKLYTDHKNMTCDKFNTNQVLCWGLILEEYSLYIDYIPEMKNIREDALSRLTNNRNQ